MLMHRVAAGDEAAINELYDRFSSLVYKVAWQFNPSHADAEDAVQEIFVRLWRTADRFDPRRAKLVTWVMLIARRHLIDRLRRKSVRPSMSGFEGDHSAPPEETNLSAQIEEANLKLLDKLKDLPELQRTVIERAYLHGFTLREISEQLDAPLGTIKSALSRGLARLRDRGAQDWAI
jgi:RNA polymerase sigma-70 factor (ECF subfamily)